MKVKKNLVVFIAIIMVLVYLYLSMATDIVSSNIIVEYLVLGMAIILGLGLMGLIYNKDGNNSAGSKNKLFNSLIEKSDTVYIMVNLKNRKIMYLSNNVEEILGIKKNQKSDNDIVVEIFNIPIIKSEISNWDKTDNYVSQLIKYDNPKYRHQMWIRIKAFIYREKSEEYYVIQISDATSEHNRQHLLITQATDIKAREAQLNQITASSYDVEMNINLVTNTYDLKYFKQDNLYFGEEKRGTYTQGLKQIIEEYINENDREMVYSNLSLDSLKEHFSKYELESVVIRYRLGNEVKNNTWLESTIFFLSSGQNNKVSVLTKNVTESAESIREQNVLLQNALNDAKIASKAKTELISAISRDVRTPLTNIIGLSESLLKKDLNKNIKEDIENINDSSNDVLDIIDNLLDVSKIEKRIVEKEESEYSILKLFKKIEENSLEYIGNKPIKINLNLDNNLPVILNGDDKRIMRALTEIVNNSIKYTNEGEINISVRGEKKGSNVKLIVEVKDTGLGIDEEKLNTIMKSKDGNSGIGYVKNLVKILGGKLEIESKVNEYTKVTVSFVQKIVEDNKVREMMNNNKTAEEFDLTGKRILIVDDNKLNLKVTSRLLEPYSVDVMLLETGEECIDLVKERNDFDLIMLDQMMPGLDGTATLEKLKTIDNFSTPVVVLTADAMTTQKEKYLSCGFDDYMSKPIDKSELSRILKKFLKDHE